MPVLIESAKYLEAIGVITFNLTIPYGTIVGDLLLVFIAKDDDPEPASSHGFTKDASITGNDHNTSVWHKIAESADITRGYVTFTGDSEDYAVLILRITGFDPDSPIDTIDTKGATGTSAIMTAPGISVSANALAFAVSGMDDDDIPYANNTAGSSYLYNYSAITCGMIIVFNRNGLLCFRDSGYLITTIDVSTIYAAGQAVNGKGGKLLAVQTILEAGDPAPDGSLVAKIYASTGAGNQKIPTGSPLATSESVGNIGVY